ncbi:MAG: hypothetical protein AAF492_28650, partial [Verrucomicrobiota bacterium]
RFNEHVDFISDVIQTRPSSTRMQVITEKLNPTIFREYNLPGLFVNGRKKQQVAEDWIVKLCLARYAILCLGALEKHHTLETSHALNRFAAAVCAYRLEHAADPTSSADLIPEFLPAEVPDPCADEPLQMKREPDGSLILFSKGAPIFTSGILRKIPMQLKLPPLDPEADRGA